MAALRVRNVVGIASLVALAGGCGGADGPELSEVYGTVRLDGQPLAGASVEFLPQGGRPSVGTTDENGYYELQYSTTREGALVGEHVVRISTFRAPDNSEGTPTPGTPEQIPAKYNARAMQNPQMNVEVAAGGEEVSFDLQSDGLFVDHDRRIRQAGILWDIDY